MHKTDDRDVLQEMLAFCRKNKGRIQVLIFPKVDRFSRYVEDYHFLKRCLRDAGIRVESTDEQFDDSPSGRLMENVIVSVAQYDNEVRAERCRDCMKEAAARGRWVCGKAPVGYRKTVHDGKSTIEPDPVRAPLIREAFTMLASGKHEPQRVRAWLESKGLPISRSRYYSLVRSRVYIGIIESFGLQARAAPPFVPLVSEAVFYRAQGAIQAKQHPDSIQRDNLSFPLRGTVRCHCSKLLTASWSQGRSKKYPYYRCKRCSGSNYKRDEVETAFLRALRSLRMELGLTGSMMDAIHQTWKSDQSTAVKNRKDLEHEISKLKGLQLAVARKSAEGVIPDEIAKTQINELSRELGQRQIELDEQSRNSHDATRVLSFAEEFLSKLDSAWKKSELDTKKRIQKFFFPDGATVEISAGRTAKYGHSTGLGGSLRPRVSAVVGRVGPRSNSVI